VVVVLDVSLSNSVMCDGRMSLSQYMDAIIAFVNCHLMLKSTNQVALIAIDTMHCEFVYPDEDSVAAMRNADAPGTGGQCELFSQVEQVMRRNVRNFMKYNLDQEMTRTEPLLEAACAQALCYIARVERDLMPGDKLNSRILIVTGSENECDKYVRCMNVIYMAQKQKVTIDVCSLDHEIALLQQACDITDGIFFKVPQIGGLLQYLLWIFLPDLMVRKKLVVPTHSKVDYRPYCFCHKQLVDVGFVCSVCLSIFCKLTPICTTCEAVFRTPARLPIKPKKKKLKHV